MGSNGASDHSDTVGDSATLPASDAPPLANTSRPVTGRPGDYATFLPVDQTHYILDREIARGGMGRIRVARDRRLRRDVAVKEILHGADSGAGLRFEREVRITARLQHPSIVSVHEAGRWPSGEPFYAMKLVTGRSLDEVITAATTLEERLALLPNVLAIADAMAYAHGERVIHRDLKPKNVLVGAFGETVVIDWGLAKDLTDTSDAADDSRGGSSDSGSETEVGEIIGTPAYMPPEQAEGKRADERSDVYSIGAILDHVLSGRAPYTGPNSLAIIIAVREGPPPSLAKRQPRVPPDLLAIVERAMARDPSERYPSARELAEDLRRYQTGQLVGAHRYSLGQLLRRWLRKHRTAVGVAGVAMLVLVVVAIVAVQRIVHSQRLEERSRRDAEALMDFMLGDLRDKLEPIGRLDILEEAARKSIAYYEQRQDADPGKRGLAHINLGDVLAKSHSDGALAEYREALAIFETIATRDPSNLFAQRHRVRALHLVGDALLARGDAPGALEQYQSSLAILESAPTLDPRLLPVTRQRLGDVRHALGEHAAALADFRASLASFEALAAKSHQDLVVQRDIIVSLNKIADVLVALGDSAGALVELRASLALAKAIRDQDDNTDSQRDVAVGHTKLGDLLVAGADLAGALAEYRAGLEIDQKLMARDPTNADRKRDVAVDHDKVGVVLAASGDTAGALVEHRASLALREVLARQATTNIDRKRELAISHELVGEMLVRRGDTDGALAELRTSLALREVVAMQPSTERADRQREIASSRDRIGDVLRLRGDKVGALEEFRAARAIREAIVETDPTNPRRQRDLSLSHDRVGDMALAENDTASALVEYRASLAIRERLAAIEPNNTNRQRDISSSHNSIGNVLFTLDDKPAALEHFRKALAIFEGLATRDPTNVEWRRSAAVMHNKVGDVVLARGDAADALAHYKASFELVDALRTADPTNTDWQADTATAYLKVGNALVGRGDKRGALAQYSAGLGIAQKLHATDRTNVEWKVLADTLAAKIAR